MPRQTRKKKGGKQLELSEMDSSKVNDMEKENENENENNSSNKSLQGGMDNALENEFSNNNNKNIEGGSENVQMQVNDIGSSHQNTNNNATNVIDSMGNMLKNAMNGLTGSSHAKVGGGGSGGNNLQNKLFTSLKARSNKLNENLLELDSLQKNLNAKTNSVKSEVQGLQEQFKLYNKMGGGRKSRKKHKKHRNSKRRSHHRRKTKHRRRRHKH